MSVEGDHFTWFSSHRNYQQRWGTRPLITYLTKQGMISPKLQLLSGHTTEQSLAVYRELALSDVTEEYERAMQRFPVR